MDKILRYLIKIEHMDSSAVVCLAERSIVNI